MIKKKVFSIILCFVLSHFLAAQQSIGGKWEGKSQSPSGETTITLHLTDPPLKGTLSSSLGLSDVNLENLSFESNELMFEVSAYAVSYSGILNGDEIEGIWKQGMGQVALTFTRDVDLKIDTHKQQEKYEIEEVQIKSGEGI